MAERDTGPESFPAVASKGGSWLRTVMNLGGVPRAEPKAPNVGRRGPRHTLRYLALSFDYTLNI